jgi:lipopolysaccharide transport system ATP-binding protein
MTVIDVRNVGKRYRRAAIGERRLRSIGGWGPSVETWALKDVSFQVDAGETLGIIGQNGSGKSTLLRLIAGVTRPTRGSVSVSRRVSGLLTMGEGFHPLLSAEENATTQAILAGLTRRQARGRLSSIAAFAELEDRMDQPLRTFSDGMRLRLGFAVAINVQPEVLLIDELLTVGDLRFQQKCLDHFDELQASGVAIVLATHDLSQVRRMCGRALLLGEGRPREIGEASEVVNRYENAMRAATPRREPLIRGGYRLGSGEVDIESVRLLDSLGCESSTVTAGQAVTVEIHYVAHRTLPDAIFGVSARSKHDDAAQFDLSTAKDGHRVGQLTGEGAVSLHLDRLELAPGSYWLDAGVYEANWDHAYDYLWPALVFDVIASSNGEAKSGPRRWSIK